MSRWMEWIRLDTSRGSRFMRGDANPGPAVDASQTAISDADPSAAAQPQQATPDRRRRVARATLSHRAEPAP